MVLDVITGSCCREEKKNVKLSLRESPHVARQVFLQAFSSLVSFLPYFQTLCALGVSAEA